MTWTDRRLGVKTCNSLQPLKTQCQISTYLCSFLNWQIPAWTHTYAPRTTPDHNKIINILSTRSHTKSHRLAVFLYQGALDAKNDISLPHTHPSHTPKDTDPLHRGSIHVNTNSNKRIIATSIQIRPFYLGINCCTPIKMVVPIFTIYIVWKAKIHN